MQISVCNKESKFDAPDGIFDRKFNSALVHQVAVSYLAGGRAGTAKQKTRAEVKASGRKPWKQKGTGNARAGAVSSPLWRHGGVTFAAKPRDYSKKVNRKMYRAAMCVILSELLRKERLQVLETLTVDEPRTKVLCRHLQAWGVQERVLVIVENYDDSDVAYVNLTLSARNVPNVEIRRVRDVTPLSLLSCRRLLITAAAMKPLQEKLL